MCRYETTHSLTINHYPKGFEADVFTGQVPFLSLKQQCQSTEG